MDSIYRNNSDENLQTEESNMKMQLRHNLLQPVRGEALHFKI